MSTPPFFLNDDGTASIATAFMTSHFALRRDLGRFAAALAEPGLSVAKIQALGEEWQSFHHHLHGHHTAEDTGVFPAMRGQQPALAIVIDRLCADHRLIDPLLERGDSMFAQLTTNATEAAALVQELRSLLEPHLALEEAELIPFLRAAKDFPPPPDEAMTDLYAEGFAWSTQGIAPDVLEQVHAMLPAGLRAKLPAAQAAFQARCDRVWGKLPPTAARTPIP